MGEINLLQYFVVKEKQKPYLEIGSLKMESN